MESPSGGCGEQFEAEFVRPRAGRTLIVGSQIYRGKEDRRQRYPEAIGVDMLAGEGVDDVVDLEEELPGWMVGAFAHVECMSVLEHSRRPWLLAANIERALQPGGTLYVSVPFCWRFHGYPSDYYRFTPQALPVLFAEVEWSALRRGAGERLLPDLKMPTIKKHGLPHFARTETFGFGVRR